MYFAGIDIGSLSAETVIIDGQEKILSYDISSTGANSKIAGERSFRQALERAGISPADLQFTVVTGYGRISLPFANKAITEITCHGRGAYQLFPETRTVLDIGGQDSKVIRLSDDGRVVDFAMNDKCAAGTGRFIEVMARALEIELEEMGPLSMKSKQDITISSMCTVFTESEVVSLVAQARPTEDIINGIHNAICKRLFAMLERVGVIAEVTMTGGVAKNAGITEKIRRHVGGMLNVPEEPQIVGALGAALIAKDCADGASN
jgi:predicted CoA-substrate-specific enzyme activase